MSQRQYLLSGCGCIYSICILFFFYFLRRRWVTTLTADSVASQHNMMWLLCGWAEDVAWGHDVNHAREVKAIRGRPFCFCAECITRHKKWGEKYSTCEKKAKQRGQTLPGFFCFLCLPQALSVLLHVSCILFSLVSNTHLPIFRILPSACTFCLFACFLGFFFLLPAVNYCLTDFTM